jgi:hypothetical protein
MKLSTLPDKDRQVGVTDHQTLIVEDQIAYEVAVLSLVPDDAVTAGAADVGVALFRGVHREPGHRYPRHQEVDWTSAPVELVPEHRHGIGHRREPEVAVQGTREQVDVPSGVAEILLAQACGVYRPDPGPAPGELQPPGPAPPFRGNSKTGGDELVAGYQLVVEDVGRGMAHRGPASSHPGPLDSNVDIFSPERLLLLPEEAPPYDARCWLYQSISS